jgi:preprotein translocase subunit SecD
MEIVVDCRAISKPVVREPLCTGPCFQLSANDIFEANALAQRLKTGSNRPCAPTS